MIESTNDNSKAVEENDESSDCDSDSHSEFSEGNKSLSELPAPTAAKRKRSNVSEVLVSFKEHIALQDKRHEENMKKHM